MAIVMLLLMRSMFQNRQRNALVLGGFGLLSVLVFFLIRPQTPVGNKAFLESMIPHPSSAIFMCQQARITDPEIQTLCGQILQSQQEEINQMKEILVRLK